MRIDRPPPSQELNTGRPAEPRPAASVIVVRDAASRGIEVLLVQRNPNARFMGGVWVFPGGTVHEGDGGPEGAARRELTEEAGIELRDGLTPFSRWITPVEIKVRFDTWFFIAPAPPGAQPACDGEECVDFCWLEPATALEAGRREELSLVFPTIKHLEQLVPLPSVKEALAAARDRDLTPVLPRIVTREGEKHLVLPGEPGYPA